jgi:vacuolar protein sorting-associated protein 13A/C
MVRAIYTRFFTNVNIQLSKYPKVNIKLHAPLELENLLPFDIVYRIYDNSIDQNWKSYLRKGGVMPVHSVELGHLILLSIDIQDTGERSLAGPI